MSVSLCLNCQINSVPFTAALTSCGGHTPASTQNTGFPRAAPLDPLKPFFVAGALWSAQFFLHFLPTCMEWNPNTWFGIIAWQVGVGQLVSTNLWPKQVKQPWSWLEISHGLEPHFKSKLHLWQNQSPCNTGGKPGPLVTSPEEPLEVQGAWICSQPRLWSLNPVHHHLWLNWSCFNRGLLKCNCFFLFNVHLANENQWMLFLYLCPLLFLFFFLVHLTHLGMKFAFFPQFTWLPWMKENIEAKTGHNPIILTQVVQSPFLSGSVHSNSVKIFFSTWSILGEGTHYKSCLWWLGCYFIKY